MAKPKTWADRFREQLESLSDTIPEELRLPSLAENCLEGYAYLYRLVLPLLNAQGKNVFTDPILDELFRVLDDRFGGCMVASSSTPPPLWGLWHPPQASQAEKDYLTTAEPRGVKPRGVKPRGEPRGVRNFFRQETRRIAGKPGSILETNPGYCFPGRGFSLKFAVVMRRRLSPHVLR